MKTTVPLIPGKKPLIKSRGIRCLLAAWIFLTAAGGLKAEEAPMEKDFTYTGIDGNQHAIKAYFPADHQPADRRPCYIFFHGGGWKSGDLNQGKPFCEYLASRGIVALTANYSMHAKGSSLSLADGESRKRICVIDAKSVIRWVKQHAGKLGIDPDMLIVSGASAGAHISVLQMMDDRFNNPADPQGVDTKVQAFVLLAGAFTLPEQDKTPEVNVFQHVDKPFPPTLFICGETDRWATATRELARQLNGKSGNEIEFWLAPEMGHMFFRTSPDWYSATKLLIDRFLQDHGFLTGTPSLEAPGEEIQLRRIDL